MGFFEDAFISILNKNITARINNILNYKRPAFWAIFSSIAAVTILAFLLLANPVSGYSIYKHPGTFLDQNSLRTPAKVRIVDHLFGDEYLLTDANEIALVTAIVEDMRIRKGIEQGSRRNFRQPLCDFLL